MKRGQKTQPPAALHLIAGSGVGNGASPPDADPLPALEPAVPPTWLSNDARALWDHLAPMTTPGSLHAATAHTFAMLVSSLATYAEADQVVNSSGILIAAGQGNDLIPNPALAIRDRQDAIAARWAKVFGLSPDATTRPKAPGAPRRPRHTVEG